MSLEPSATNGDGPVVKRQKLTNGIRKGNVQGSRIFAPFRLKTVGLVSSTDVPFTSIPLGKTSFQVTTSVGRCLQTYDLKKGLNLVFLTRPQTPQVITATLAWKDVIFAAWGDGKSPPGLWVFKRGKKIHELAMPEETSDSIKQILVFGSWLVGRCKNRIEIWKNTASHYEHYTTLYSIGQNGGNEITALTNMPTFLNKIFAGRTDGSVDIWNVSTGKLIYTVLPPTSDCGAVTALQSTPALSLMAIAYSEGPIVLHDIRLDKTKILLHSETAVTSISFRTDGLGAGEDGREDGVMVTTGLQNGDVTFWDLNKGGRVMGVLRGAHSPPSVTDTTVRGGINKVDFLAGQPIVITSGLDNCLKSWLFDETPYSPVPRLLHSRNGHAAPITRLQFLPSDADGVDAGGKWLLSSARDRSLWGWSLRRDGQSTELSQGNIRKKAKKLGILGGVTLANESSTALEDLKAPEITCMASSLNRDGGIGANADGGVWQKGQGSRRGVDATKSGLTGWESVVTGHKDDRFARTWFWGRKKAGRWILETGDGAHVSCVAMSPCGTFAVIGSEAGGIDMYNLQSGIHRQRFPSRLTPAQARKLKLEQIEGKVAARRFNIGTGRHSRAVSGVVVDSLNKNVISCSLDGSIKFWDFASGNLVDEIDWYPMTGITAMKYHAPNDLIALSCNDLSMRVVDIVTRKTIRELWGCQGGINDFCFSNDGRWIIAASGDGIIRVWDLPTGHLIDAIRTSRICTALAFSGTGEFLATAFEGEIGVNIWNNKTLFTHTPTRHISENEIAQVSTPTVSGEGSAGLLESAFDNDEGRSTDAAPVLSLEQISADMLTLSLVPKSKWQTLLHLDLIKQRNKPKEAPKAPENAPFFLPSLESAQPTSAVLTTESRAEVTANTTSRVMKMDRNAAEGQFTISLRLAHQSQIYTPFIDHLKSLSPSAADLELRSLNPMYGADELVTFVKALTWRLREKKDYELVQAWMIVFLKLHGESVLDDDELRNALREWKTEQSREAKRLGELVGYCSGVVGFLRSPRT